MHEGTKEQSCRSSIQATIKEYPGMTREEARIGAAGSCRALQDKRKLNSENGFSL
jgi:hypothetical protein